MTESDRKRFEDVLALVRPYLEADKGDIELVSFNASTGVLELRFVGACRTCAMSAMTLRAGIERVVRQKLPEVRRVEAVS
ncbi:MAG: NifU family protein [Candidatus Kapabacteria bacterium]|nr:NifU family protein [Candidatus Kapabacteria bacterium]